MFDLKTLVDSHFGHVTPIPASAIAQRPEVRELCKQNACGQYGKNWACPPAVPSLDELKQRFEPFDSFLVIWEVYPLKSGFDWKGMMEGAALFTQSLSAMKEALDETVFRNDYLILGAGACGLCKTCTYGEGKPCRRPDDAIVSLEACGIDVMALMKDHGMKYYNGPNTVTYVGGVFYHSL